MLKIKNLHRITQLCMILVAVLFITACSSMGTAIDPGDWFYDCVVTYDALGGTINSRGIRETYYMANSYLFEPSGTTNMLIQPIKDGYILAGWYTSKEEIFDEQGDVIGYSFRAEDRWDFNEDRVQGDLTLYARWIPQGKVDYTDASSGEIMFTKNITTDSPVQKLSSAAENLIAKQGHTLYGYYSDKECTQPYLFSDYTHTELIPSDEEIYAQLFQEFPQYFKKIAFVEPENIDELEEDTSDLFINRLGYEITTDDKAARQEIRKRKDEIIEQSIASYTLNTAEKIVYLKYIEGNYVRVASADDIRSGGNYGFTGVDSTGKPVNGYILSNDIDLKGAAVRMVDTFSGRIYGNGFSIKNIEINISSRKLDQDTSKSAGLFDTLDGAYIENLTFENFTINSNVKSGMPVTIGALAINAKNTTLKNLTFNGLTIKTGKGDDGTAKYRISDLFVDGANNQLENVNGTNIEIMASEFAELHSVFQ